VATVGDLCEMFAVGADMMVTKLQEVAEELRKDHINLASVAQNLVDFTDFIVLGTLTIEELNELTKKIVAEKSTEN
jgi:hypothetical protein